MAPIFEIGEASPSDLAPHPVWEFILDDEVTLGETHVS